MKTIAALALAASVMMAANAALAASPSPAELPPDVAAAEWRLMLSLGSCAVLGDSIAVRVGMAAPGCKTAAKVGISSVAYAKDYPAEVDAERVVISLGANDDGVDTGKALRLVRSRIHALHVAWLMPHIQRQAQLRAIEEVASENGDAVVDTAPDVGPDGLHPTAQGAMNLAMLTGINPHAMEYHNARIQHSR